MGAPRDEMWSASLDGELSAAEAAAFEQSLTPAQKSALGAEVKFERALSERLSRQALCPDDVWKRTLTAVQNVNTSKPRKGLSISKYAATAAAAVFVIAAAGAALYAHEMREPSILAMTDSDTISKFMNDAQLKGASDAEINDFLEQQGFSFTVTEERRAIRLGRHRPEMIGVMPVTYHGEHVMEFFFECCGRPLKVIVAKSGGRVAEEIGHALASGGLQASKPVNGYVAAVVGRHKSNGILDFLADGTT